MKTKTIILLFIVAACLALTFSCERDDLDPDPSVGRSFPKELVLTYDIGGWWWSKDTSIYKYEYNQDRISVITRQTRRWDTNGVAAGHLVFAGSILEVMKFSYLDRKILIDVTSNGNRSGSFVFNFDNDQLLYPSSFQEFDASGILTQNQIQFSYDNDGFINSIDAVKFSVQSGNIDYAGQVFYSTTQSPINQYSGFDFFRYRPLIGGIDPVGITFKWFRFSKHLIDKKGWVTEMAYYSYNYSDTQLSSITCECMCMEHVLWKASIKY